MRSFNCNSDLMTNIHSHLQRFLTLFDQNRLNIQVTFTGENIPVHPHVYSNGHICLSILSDDWTPVSANKF